jgi:hypothetical protein
MAMMSEKPPSGKGLVSFEHEVHPKDQCAYVIYSVLRNYGSESFRSNDIPEIT